ncbi:MAG: fumarylacetoacetate hydrolase family protein [Cytophagaceae bacterium]|jgi:2-keto-4-pentenoate hydratase/2-oxohepta-3-ene-1,7-dioic acid hydratase in catechol pathway|nr:fumarylacetoacetate hydrolase family protein [Cytophagaceae bacterium]
MKIFCIGHNYEAHAKELKNLLPAEPVIFMKPDTALLRNNAPFYIPNFSGEVHHEVELVFRINRLGKGINEKFAHRYYNEIGLGIDFTARDIQYQLMQKGLPWEKCKAFDGSAVISEFVDVNHYSNPNAISFRLEVNGDVRQHGNSGDMLFGVDRIISELSKYFTLKIGDLIYTGTPAGIGAVAIGDRLKGFIEDECFFDFVVK